MTALGLLERAVLPLDAARKVAFRVTLESRLMAWLLPRRDRRLAALLSVQAVMAFALTLFVPTLLLMLGPVLLGVVHVAADVRYLVLRRRLAAWWKNAIWGFCGLLVAVRVLHEARILPRDPSRLEFALTGLFMGVACALGTLESRARRRGFIAAFAVLAFTSLTVLFPGYARLVFAQVHNFIALGLWMLLFRRRLTPVAAPLLLVLLGFALLGSGVLSGFILETPHPKAFDTHLLEVVDWMAPGLPLMLGVGVTCSFIFGQSIHYATWLTLVPQDDAKAEGILSFRGSVRGLMADFGALGLGAIVLAASVVIAFAFVTVRGSRELYLSLAMFHGYMELVLFTYFVCRGREHAHTAA